MFPDWFVVLVAAACGMVAVYLFVKSIIRGWRSPATTYDAVDAARPAEPATAAPAYSQAKGFEAILAEPSRSSSSGTPASNSWSSTRLFTPLDAQRVADDNTLPAVEPEQVPSVDGSDLMFGPLTKLLASLTPETAARQVEIKKELKAAGYYGPHAFQNFSAIRILAMFLPLVLLAGLFIALPRHARLPIAVVMVLAPLVGWALPGLLVRLKAASRTREIEHAMPDMLDMVNMCVSQGLTVGESLNRVGRELKPVYPALSRELSIVSEQSEVGTLRHALENFSQRIDMPEVNSFTSLLIQTDRMGTSVSAALTEYSDDMRESLRQRADAHANRASFVLLFPTVFCLMPAVYMFLMGPAVIELSGFFSEGGQKLMDQRTQAVEQFETQRARLSATSPQGNAFE